MKVYALVGKSGTGKSYKALEVAYEKKIDYIVDDGILIHKNKIIAGISAKHAKTVMEAVKRAIFYDIEHRNLVKEKIEKEEVNKILILGTSIKMINEITSKLDIKEDYEVIDISDISTQYEIEKAKESRLKGNHIIPVPTVQIKSISNGLSINSLKRLFKKDNQVKTVLEKTVIRPAFSYIGKFFISPNVIEQIIYYEVDNFSKVDKINRLDISNTNNNIEIYMSVSINDSTVINECNLIQKNIKESIEKITLINVSKIDIYINKLKKNI